MAAAQSRTRSSDFEQRTWQQNGITYTMAVVETAQLVRHRMNITQRHY